MTGELQATKNFSLQGKTARTHIYYKNGNVRASGLYVDKVKDSLWNYFNIDNILIGSEEYKSGELDGEGKTYYETGELFIIQQWLSGLEHGDFIKYFINQQVNIKTSYHHGLLNGDYINYDPDGNIVVTGGYLLGEKVGEWRYYSDNLLDTVIYE